MNIRTRILGAATLAAGIVLGTLVFAEAPASASRFAPQPVYLADQDLDADRIQDRLEASVRDARAAGEAGRSVGVIVTLTEPPTDTDLTLFRERGGAPQFIYRTAVYGFAGVLPAGEVESLRQALGGRVWFIEEDALGGAHLDDATRQTRVRPLVWDPVGGYGLRGDPDIVIGICDTGIDGTHTDLSGRIAYWQDFTAEGEPAATDRNGHGSHVAGIAAGTGAALGSAPIASLTTTMSGLLPATDTYGYVDMIKVPVLGGGQVTSNLLWTGGGTAQVNLAQSVPGWLGGATSNTSPLTKTWNITATDIYKARAGNQAGAGNKPFSMLTTYPYVQVGDGHNLFGGVAPLCKLAGIKLLKQDGSGLASVWTAAFDWIAANNVAQKIAVANASIGLYTGSTNAALRTAANSVVSAGTVLVISAANDYPTYRIPDPGLAEKALTVGAVNDFGAMTQYSSNGPVGSSKPDVAAPGGSQSWNTNVGSEITSVDTNVNDAATTGFADRQANDYTNIYGTSMAAPNVTGIAALLAQEQGWGYSEFQALHTKMLILMTATETNQAGEESSGNNPTLQRGGKDLIEGYGKVNADAAVEALVNFVVIPPDTQISVTLGSGPFDRKAWATGLGLDGPLTFIFDLSVPPTADYDLYVYSWYYAGNGEPQIEYSSTNAGLDADESISITQDQPVGTTHYLVIKQVGGSGTATLRVRSGVLAVGPGEPAARLSLSPGYPNPFRGATTMGFSLPGNGARAVELAVFDLHGARVRTLISGPRSGGAHAVEWDGRDATGQRLSPGMYFVRLRADGQQRIGRVVMVH